MEGEIDYRKIYMTKIDHKHTRVGKDYQAVIPEFKPKDKKAQNINKNKDLNQLNHEHKAHYIYNKEDERDDPLTPNKKRKIDEPTSNLK